MAQRTVENIERKNIGDELEAKIRVNSEVLGIQDILKFERRKVVNGLLSKLGIRSEVTCIDGKYDLVVQEEERIGA